MKITYQLGPSQSAVENGLQQLSAQKIIPRIWAHDHTVWKPEPDEITNRLGWLHIAEAMQAEIARLEALREALIGQGYTHAVVLGMGGSSLAPEVFSNTFDARRPCLHVQILDSTDPGVVLALEEDLNLHTTLFIVATKSGGTVETLSAFKYFYNQVVDLIGSDQAGKHFIAITDPGSKLVAMAEKHNFREILLNDPDIGGRYSALSFFGLVPAALAGVELPELLQRAGQMTAQCKANISIDANPAAILGAVLGKLALAGKDKVTFAASPTISDFPNWVEQLIAESTGKEGRGILPVVDEAFGPPEVYDDDRVFVHLKVGNDQTHRAALDALAGAGQPVIEIHLQDEYDLGGQFFVWELATAIAGYFLGINPFDQPDVESAKMLARQMVAAYAESGQLPAGQTSVPAASALREFLAVCTPGSYVALQAYLHPTPEAEAALAKIRLEIRDTYHVATTLGFGPRFLHSTGQLHKGDRGQGMFIQLVSDAPQDLAIPDEIGSTASAMSFDTLKKAQALGDAQALRQAGRQVIVFAMQGDLVEAIGTLR